MITVVARGFRVEGQQIRVLERGSKRRDLFGLVDEFHRVIVPATFAPGLRAP
jgi:hypothetical protein